jgi:RIO kinase 1
MTWKSDLENLLKKTEAEVFGKITLKSLEKLLDFGYIDSFEFPISTGKEGNVFRAKCKKKYIAVKIYRINTATFKHISKYLMYEHTKNVGKSRSSVIFAWALKEFNNLKKLNSLGVRVPKPIVNEGNIIVMEYIGTEQRPAPLIKNAVIHNPKKIFDIIKKYLKIIYCEGNLIHSDFSEYNILLHNNKPVIIDLGQMIRINNPMAKEYLQRDVANIAKFFSRYIDIDTDQVVKYIMRC